ncbi:MAG: phosphoenolpyruvate carboxylase [Candidatus Levybacteria bacterium]|nr:phosphoenolpyruvate carboxylase [Candidatus Levybacteria bacterium]
MVKITRKIPATMVTQHPDHAGKPYWHNEKFIQSQFEAHEAYLSFSELGATEYKWDWEGKLVDESVLERLFGEHFNYFKKNPLGQEKFLTFRLPNPKVETEFRVGRAFINLASAASIAKHFNLPTPPIFEVILPMTETAEEILEIQKAYQQVHFLKHSLYKLDKILTNLRVIPLFEQTEVIIKSSDILKKYLLMYKKRFKKTPPYLRPYLARSDPALNSGIVPTVLAIKIALSRFRLLEKKLKIPLFPIIGAAALPFRGGISPRTVRQFANEYKGVRTTTIQSAFRYDFDKREVIKAIKELEEILPTQQAVLISKTEEKELLRIIEIFEKHYKDTIEQLSVLINQISLHIPKRRERVQHTGLFGYSRGVGKIKLPRAIPLTGSLYSIGIPPELLGTGRGLNSLNKKQLKLLEKYYINIKSDLLKAGGFLNKRVLEELSKNTKYGKDIAEDVKAIEDYLGVSLLPISKEEKLHQALSERIYKGIKNKKQIGKLIEKAAVFRRSLG